MATVKSGCSGVSRGVCGCVGGVWVCVWGEGGGGCVGVGICAVGEFILVPRGSMILFSSASHLTVSGLDGYMDDMMDSIAIINVEALLSCRSCSLRTRSGRDQSSISASG